GRRASASAPPRRARAPGGRARGPGRRRCALRRPGATQSLGWAWPRQSTAFASRYPATKAPAITSSGLGPPPLLLRAGFGAAAGDTTPVSSGGRSPCTREAIALGFSLRRNCASSTSSWRRRALKPFPPARRAEVCSRRSAPFSISSSTVISSPEAPRPSRRARSAMRAAAPRAGCRPGAHSTRASSTSEDLGNRTPVPANATSYAAPMEVPGRALGKLERQRLIGSLVARKRIGTQLELLDALAAAGCRVTQATISRDVKQLGLQKSRDPLGRPRYALPQRVGRTSPEDALAGVLGQFGRRAAAAQNIVVVVSELGTAPAIARTL